MWVPTLHCSPLLAMFSMWGTGSSAILDNKRSAGVPLELNLRERISISICHCQVWIMLRTLAWNPEETSPGVQNRGASGPKSGQVSDKNKDISEIGHVWSERHTCNTARLTLQGEKGHYARDPLEETAGAYCIKSPTLRDLAVNLSLTAKLNKAKCQFVPYTCTVTLTRFFTGYLFVRMWHCITV